ncbi:TRAP transporter substrate-binding protein [Azospirillum ramasamyi]|uniref:ABC transporter substrate-binding protein n=1 Tax=Azospirillum ramasamyi TaxID=682998 RepID=A0A2U9SC39_9PROT|nr:TRAP transporter substrate-binding protein [Azospirillum ramasamyi]AWU96166.1 ABC transporter substrate-binding protein [Azospirillum ramasamyi]
MKRRAFLSSAGVGIAAAGTAGTIAAPAIAQTSQPEIKWRMASSYPKSLDTIYGAAEFIAKRVSDATDGRFQIRPFAAGEIVPALQVLDAVQNGTVECGQSAAYFYVGKDPTFCFDTAMPFGMNTRQHIAWMMHGGGLELMREVFKDYNIHHIPAGNTSAQMGGWFRKEIKSLEDLNGLKMRIGGLVGQILMPFGLVPQQLGGGDIYPALERGTIDAAEFVGPYDDEKLGFYKVAKYYYYPGWWEGSAQIPLMFNMQAWESLPKSYQTILEQACWEANTWMIAKYDTLNAAALKRLVAGGAVLRPFPRDMMQACEKASFEFYDKLAAGNPRFKKVYDGWKPFLEQERLWFRVAENGFDSFVYSQAAQQR